MIRYFKKSFVRYLAYGLAIALLSFLFGLFKVKALTCTGQAGGGATYVDYSIVSTVGENIGGFIWYRSNSDNGYITVVCQTNATATNENEEKFQNLIISGTSFKIKSASAFAGAGYFSDVLAYPTDVFSQVVGNYNIGFGAGNSTFVNENYTGFSYGFSRVSTDQKIAFRVYVNNTNNERKTISFYSYSNSYEFLVGGGANSFEAMLAAFQQSQSNYNTDVINGSINDVNQSINDLNSNVTDSNPPDNLSALSNSAGWLPAGPVDGILNLPLTLFNNMFNNLSKTCEPVTLPLPYVDANLQLPCVNSLYAQIEGASTWINGVVGVVASAIILYYYLLHLYKYVDDTLTFRENNLIDNWSGV